MEGTTTTTAVQTRHLFYYIAAVRGTLPLALFSDRRALVVSSAVSTALLILFISIVPGMMFRCRDLLTSGAASLKSTLNIYC